MEFHQNRAEIPWINNWIWNRKQVWNFMKSEIYIIKLFQIDVWMFFLKKCKSSYQHGVQFCDKTNFTCFISSSLISFSGCKFDNFMLWPKQKIIPQLFCDWKNCKNWFHLILLTSCYWRSILDFLARVSSVFANWIFVSVKLNDFPKYKTYSIFGTCRDVKNASRSSNNKSLLAWD